MSRSSGSELELTSSPSLPRLFLFLLRLGGETVGVAHSHVLGEQHAGEAEAGRILKIKRQRKINDKEKDEKEREVWWEKTSYHSYCPSLGEHLRLLGVVVWQKGALECLPKPLLDLGRPRRLPRQHRP